MFPPPLCTATHGPRGRCELPALHASDHAQGEVRWPRSDREQAAFQRAQVDLVRLHQQWTRGARRVDAPRAL